MQEREDERKIGRIGLKHLSVWREKGREGRRRKKSSSKKSSFIKGAP